MTARARRRLGAALVVASLAWLGAAAAPAWAHDVLVSTSPVGGSTVAKVPDAVVLTFDQPALALGSAVQVMGPSGDVSAGAPALVDTTVREPLRAGSPAGSYTVRWRVTSADGHPVSGSFTFTALAAGGSAATVSTNGTSRGNGAPGSSSVLWWWVAAAVAALVLVAAYAMNRRRGAPASVRERPGGADD